YTHTGSDTVTVTAKDKDGATSLVATQVETIKMVEYQNGTTDLAIGSNLAGGDTIVVSAVDNSGTNLNVAINKVSQGNFKPTGHVFIYGQGGGDAVSFKPFVSGGKTYNIHVPAFIYGEGSGGDKFSVAGSDANNVLVGHGANEV